MQYPSVLVQVVAAGGLPPEPVATDALVHILRRSQAARSALTLLASDLCPTLPSAPLSFRGQVRAREGSSRPDLIGSDGLGPRVVIEAKFDAELTPSQLSDAYLKPLPPNQPGLLLYIAPSDRLPSLWPQLLAGPSGLAVVAPPNLANADQPWLAHVMDDGRAVGIVSWTTLLTRLEEALLDANDAGATSTSWPDWWPGAPPSSGCRMSPATCRTGQLGNS